MNIRKRLFGEWRYVGRVWAQTTLVNGDGTKKPGGELIGGWVLTQHTSGKRRSEKVGDAGRSAAADVVRLEVRSWVAGGPLPRDAETAEPKRDSGEEIEFTRKVEAAPHGKTRTKTKDR